MVVPDTSLGQHWLHNAAALSSIADMADLGKEDTVLEIGPGLGTLTSLLAKRAKQVIAVEIDGDLARDLPKRVQSRNIMVVHQDILEYDLTGLPFGYAVVANVPYYITSKIIRLLLESSNPPSVMVLLVQKEVAERIAAKPGQMNMLAVSAQFYADVTLGSVIPARLFTPPPQVDSQIVRLIYRGPYFDDILPAQFFRIVKAGFAKRRKQLRSSLSGGLHLSKPAVDVLLAAAHVPPRARAQELTLDQWHQLARCSTQR